MESAFEIPSFRQTCAQLSATLEPRSSSVLYTFPFCGHHYRLQTIISCLSTKQQQRAAIMQPSVALDESVAEIVRAIKNNALIFLPQSELLLRPGKQYWLEKIINSLESSQASLVWLAELLPLQLKHIQPNVLAKLITHQFFLPQLNLTETEAFIHYLESKFATSVNVSAQEIHDETGGNMWLIKEIVRQHAKPKLRLKHIIASPGYMAKASLIYERLPQTGKLVVTALQNKETTTQTEIMHQLSSLGIILPNGRLPQYLSRLAGAKKAHQLELADNHHILLNQVRITDHFSLTQQQLIRRLVNAQGMLVRRTELAALVWPDGDYSDWALDQAISRLKQKLVSLGLSKDTITTIRKVGYVFARPLTSL